MARLHGRSAVIPNQGLLITTISLPDAKLSSEIENIFTTDDELYKAYSDQHSEAIGASKEVLRYREALWSGYNYLKEGGMFNQEYFIKIFQEIKQTTDKIRTFSCGSGYDPGYGLVHTVKSILEHFWGHQ